MTADSKTGRAGALFLGGVGAGAALMYLFDPDRGAQRRAKLRDQAAHLAAQERDLVDKGVRDLRHRSGGIIARLRTRRKEVSDDILIERVRAQLGHWVSHPRTIEVEARQGQLVLRGPILADELKPLLRRVGTVRGVRGVNNLLEPHESPDIPALRGEPSPRLRRASGAWTPSLRLLAAVAGMTTSIYGLSRGGLARIGLSALGGALLLRSFTNLSARRLLGIDTSPRLIHLRKALVVGAPIPEVFAFWAHYQNFPRFMKHVRDVAPTGPNRSRWTVVGPAGTELSFEAETTSFAPPHLIGWRTPPGEVVEHTGVVRFERLGDHRTRVHVEMSYNPPGGAVGHAVAKFFGRDAKTAMDEDLLRMKSLLEEGKTRVAGKPVHREQLLR